jgi:hypothetical protein
MSLLDDLHPEYKEAELTETEQKAQDFEEALVLVIGLADYQRKNPGKDVSERIVAIGKDVLAKYRSKK